MGVLRVDQSLSWVRYCGFVSSWAADVRCFALDHGAVAAWRELTGEEAPVWDPDRDPDGAFVVVGPVEEGLLGVVGEVMAAGMRPVVPAGGVGLGVAASLLSAGFEPSEVEGVSVLRGPAFRPADVRVSGALAGPVAVRALCGVAGTAEAVASDVGARHRVLVEDGTAAARWVGRLASPGTDAVQVRVGLPRRPRVRPLRTDSNERVVIDCDPPAGVVVVGDSSPATLERLARGLRWAGSPL